MEISNPRRILAVSLEASTQQLSKIIKGEPTRRRARISPRRRIGDAASRKRPTLRSRSQGSPGSKPPADNRIDLTGSHPEPVSSTLAGTTHNLPITTPYYTAQVPIWLDLVTSPSEWADTFLSDEAKEVLEVIGGIVVIFAISGPSAQPPLSSSSSGSSTRAPATKEETKAFISHVGRVVREGLGGWEWDGVSLGIGVGDLGTDDPDALDEWEDACADVGLEFVHVRATQAQGADKAVDKASEEARNEFGERMGIARALEALQSNDWEGRGAAEDEDDDEFELGELSKEGEKGSESKGQDADSELDPESLGFGFDRADFEGLKKAIWSSGQGNSEDFMDDQGQASTEKPEKDGGGEDQELGDEDVQKLERMFTKLQAVRDKSAGLPEEQRQRIAKKAVAEVMREL